MLKYFLFSGIYFLPLNGLSQRLYIVPNFDLQYSGLSFVRRSEKNASDFKPSIPLLNFMASLDIFYKPKKIIHKLTIESNRFGDGFGVTNKFIHPGEIGLLGISHSGGFDNFIISYNAGIESKKLHNPLGKLKLRYTGSLGAGIGLNRTMAYFDDVIYPIDYGWQDGNTYIAYLGSFSKTGPGLFSIVNAGFDVISKHNKRVLNFSFFYNKGFTEMVRFYIHYQYGFFNDPARQTDVPKQVLRSRGTSFGLKIGIPIKILK